MPGVVNGTPVDAPTTNAALLAKNGDDSTVGKVGLANTDPVSGTGVTNIQREHNSVAFYAGKALNAIKNVLPAWVSTAAGTGGDDLTQRAEALTVKFETTGHNHDGTAGNGGTIAAVSINAVTLKGSFVRGVDLAGVTGASTNVSVIMAGKAVSTSSTVIGVVTTAPYNKTSLLNSTNGDYLLDTLGNTVYGRVTNSGGPSGTWTLTYFVDLTGVETAYSFPSPAGVRWFYQELQNPITGGNIYSEQASMPSDNATQDVLDASPTQRGVVSTGAQSLAGTKTFTGAVNIDGATRLAVALTGILKAAAGVVSTGLVNLATEVTGLLGVGNGGTGANLSATGGTGQYLKQVTVGAAATVGTIPAVDYPTMLGANGITPGTKGAVPTPAALDNVKFLRGDATWAVSGGGLSKSIVTIGVSGSGADYTTTGTNDHLVFNSAVLDARLNAGGILHILAGTYNFPGAHTWSSTVAYRGVHASQVTLNITLSQSAGAGSYDLSGITFTDSSLNTNLSFTGAANVRVHECAAVLTFRINFSTTGGSAIVENCIFAGSPQFSETLTAINTTYSGTLFFSNNLAKLNAVRCTINILSDVGAGINTSGLNLVGCTVTTITPSGSMVWKLARITGCNIVNGIPADITGTFSGNIPLALDGNLIRKPSPENRTNNAVLTNDGHFVFDVQVDVVYSIRAVLIALCASAVPDIQVTLTAPAFTAGTQVITCITATGGVEHVTNGVFGSSSGTLSIVAAGASVVNIDGAFIAGGTGQVRLQWAQASSNANAVTLDANSTMEIRRI